MKVIITNTHNFRSVSKLLTRKSKVKIHKIFHTPPGGCFLQLDTWSLHIKQQLTRTFWLIDDWETQEHLLFAKTERVPWNNWGVFTPPLGVHNMPLRIHYVCYFPLKLQVNLMPYYHARKSCPMWFSNAGNSQTLLCVLTKYGLLCFVLFHLFFIFSLVCQLAK